VNILDISGKKNLAFRMLHGEALFQYGQVAQNIFLIERGTLQIIDAQSNTAIRQYGAGDLVGIPEVLGGMRWPATGIIHGVSDVRIFSGTALLQRIDEMPNESKGFIAGLASLCA
jgi:CRP-like cAMP-binding protein